MDNINLRLPGLIAAGGPPPVWQFHFATNQAMPYFHPLTLPGEPPLTWLSPPDHRWHYGLWFAWKYLNRKNYWDFDPKTARYEGVTRWSNVQVATNQDWSARIELDLTYQPADNSKPVWRERRLIAVSAPDREGSYHLDWTMTCKMGVGMLDDPRNLHSPCPWYVALDAATPFGCLIAAPLFHRGYTLEANKSVTLRYRIALHPGRWDAPRLQRESEEFHHR